MVTLSNGRPFQTDHVILNPILIQKSKPLGKTTKQEGVTDNVRRKHATLRYG